MIRTVLPALSAVMLSALSALPSNAQGLDENERRIVAAVDARADDALRLIATTVSIPSATNNIAGVRNVGEVLLAELSSMGFVSRWEEMPPEMKRAGHLIAEKSGGEGRRLLLLGHLDTVLESESFARKGDIAYGSGVADMKGGNVVLVAALKALQDAGVLTGRRLVVMLTGDEELPGEPLTQSRRALVEAAKRSDIALSFESTVRNTATIARRGSSFWTLEVSGSTGHSAGIFGPNRGSGAIFEAARILSAFHEALRGEQYLTLNPSVVVGGTDVTFRDDAGTATGKPNVVAQRVVVRGDLRFISDAQETSARARMQEIVTRSLPQTRATIEFQSGYPAMAPTDANMDLLRQLSEVSQVLGGGPVEPLGAGERGAGDMSFAAPYIPGLDGLGIRLHGTITHAPGEAAELASLPFLIKRAAVLIYRLTRQAP